jgi:hypothetical protein
MAGEDLLETFDRLADLVRHPALTLDVFTSDPIEDSQGSEDSDDRVVDEPDDKTISDALDRAALQIARRRRGALMFAANLVFDRIVDDLVVSDADRERLGVDRFVDEHLPSRLRHRYDASFLRKLLATTGKVAQDLAGEQFTYPACTAEELVLWAILREWEVLLDLTDLGQAWTTLSEYLFEDLDFEYLFDADMDGVENDPLAHKTSNIDVRPLADWFTPFNIGLQVHPYAVKVHERDQPGLFDLTQSDDHGHHLTHPVALGEMPATVDGLDPVSELVAAARRHARTRLAQGEWVPDENDPARSFAEIAVRPTTSGILIHQTGPDGEITQVPVLSLIPQPAHPCTGACWAEVMYFSGRTELPLAAVVSFTADPTVRERWNAAFTPLPRGS